MTTLFLLYILVVWQYLAYVNKILKEDWYESVRQIFCPIEYDIHLINDQYELATWLRVFFMMILILILLS